MILIDLGEPLCPGTVNGILMPALEECLCKNNPRQIVKNLMLKVTRIGLTKALWFKTV